MFKKYQLPVAELVMRQAVLNMLETLSERTDLVRLVISTVLFALLVLVALYHQATFGGEVF